MKSKPIYQSKTFWLNVIGFLLVVIPAFANIQLVDPKYLGGAMAILNILMRYITDQPVTL